MNALEQSFFRGLGLVLLVGICFFSADLAAAAIERQLALEPQVLKPPAVVNSNSNQLAVPPGLVEVLEATRPPESEDTQSPVASSSGGNPTSAPVSVPVGNLTLKGTMAGQGLSLAMIEVNGKTEMIGIGEAVADYTLVEVGPYSATLKKGEQTSTLEMKMARIPETGATKPVPAPVRPKQTNPRASAPKPILAKGAPQTVTMSQKEFRKLINNPPPNTIQLRRVQRGDEIVGVQIRIRDPNHPLARLGIQNNDIVTSVNEEKLSGPESLATVYRVLRNSPKLRFMVERGGQKIPLKVNFTD